MKMWYLHMFFYGLKILAIDDVFIFSKQQRSESFYKSIWCVFVSDLKHEESVTNLL